MPILTTGLTAPKMLENAKILENLENAKAFVLLMPILTTGLTAPKMLENANFLENLENAKAFVLLMPTSTTGYEEPFALLTAPPSWPQCYNAFINTCPSLSAPDLFLPAFSSDSDDAPHFLLVL